MSVKKVLDHLYKTENSRYLRQRPAPGLTPPEPDDPDTRQRAHEAALEAVFEAGRAEGRRER